MKIFVQVVDAKRGPVVVRARPVSGGIVGDLAHEVFPGSTFETLTFSDLVQLGDGAHTIGAPTTNADLSIPPRDYLVHVLGLDSQQADLITNKFVSAAQRRWYFANRGELQRQKTQKTLGGTNAALTPEAFARLDAQGTSNIQQAESLPGLPSYQRAMTALSARMARDDKDLEKVRKAILRKETSVSKKWDKAHEANVEMATKAKEYSQLNQKDPAAAKEFLAEQLQPAIDRCTEWNRKATTADLDLRKKCHELIAKHVMEKSEIIGDVGSIIRDVQGGGPMESFTKAKPFLNAISRIYRWSVNPTEAVEIPADRKQRSFHREIDTPDGSKSQINMAIYDGGNTFVHEFGHAMETAPEVSRMAKAFMAMRTKGQGFAKMREVDPNRSYDPDEVGAENDFGKAFGEHARYVGKYYPHGATEITSMGMEMLYKDPVGFAKNDPQYFKFIMGVIDGSVTKSVDGELQQ